MTNEEKIMRFKQLISSIDASNSYEVLEETGDLKTNYWDYMTTEPVNCNEELKRLECADYDLCSALLTMLLREDHFCDGAFDQRVESGQVECIVQRMIKLLEKQGKVYL